MSPLHFFCSEFTAEADGFFLNELLISFQLSPGPLAKSFYRSCSAAELASRQKIKHLELTESKEKSRKSMYLTLFRDHPISNFVFLSDLFIKQKY